MSETGWQPYGLSAYFCEECGRPKSLRLWPGQLTGCKTCDDVITRHRCTERPDIREMPDDGTWECADCGSEWTVRAELEDCSSCCGECGHKTWHRTWERTIEGPRMDSAPKHQPVRYTPFRDRLRGGAG